MDDLVSSSQDRPAGRLIADGDLRLVQALRGGDEAAFTQLVEQYHPSMLRVAMIYVPDRAVAEEVVQETWVGVLRGLNRFEGRSSLKTWMFTILTNRAKTRAQREDRYVPLTLPDEIEDGATEPTVAPDHFQPGSGDWIDGMCPSSWDAIPEEHLLSREARAAIFQAIEALPPNQREVIRLRDVEGWSSDEVCHVLSLSEANQRVLLHRARARVRQALEHYLRI